MTNNNKSILKNTATKIVENVDNYCEKTRIEIINELKEYMDQNSSMRKIIHFYEADLKYGHDIKNCTNISDKINIFELKNEEKIKEKLIETLNKMIREENKFIINHLLNHAKENQLIKNMGKYNIEKMLEYSIYEPRVVLIADKNLKSGITNNGLYKYDNICFLDELEDSIIQIDFTKGLLDVFETSFFFNSWHNSKERIFIMHNPEEISFKAHNKDFISVIKTN